MAPSGSHRWRVPPPSSADLIRWPADFGRRFIVFVDTEEEFDWSAPFSREERSVGAIAALPEMHQRFAERGIGPCYLCDYPVVSEQAAVDVLRELMADGRSSIGAQLHPWVNPPYDEQPSPLLSFAGNLPPALEAAKLDQLTSAITSAFGAAPRAFRAGRYGLGPSTLGHLAARGYRLDTSMRAHHDYGVQGGPDFRLIDPAAFRIAGSDLIELPLTTVFTGLMRARGPRLHRLVARVPHGAGLLARSGLLSRVPLTPEGVPIEEACEAVRVAIGEGSRLLSFSFHSPSLVPGHTPYVRNAADRARFDRWWDVMLDLLDRLGLAPATLGEVLDAADRAR
ncbi:polysaccharide deacetylase family protein [Sphingomonas radiodurans]|uniref:polysaccharide deacetylase family protein n=1 Tax=Sphingomonas radiodurans TaxID=2890321 RepID=UPI001E34BD2E|nr:polysaccharide deacetylase family protein [Sphingomonas radiodurans]WBH16381.1 polysaccharide deacetylase family protein [Sphingomonas radiodurans]